MLKVNLDQKINTGGGRHRSDRSARKYYGDHF